MAETTMERPVAALRPSRTLTRVLLAFLVGAATGALGVWIGTREPFAAVRAERDAAVADASEARADLVGARSREAMMRARLAADEALRELDRQNFGLAADHLAYAAMALAVVEPRYIEGMAPEALDALRTDLEATRTELAADPAAHRARVEDLAARLAVAAGR
ncbi:MAG: hypothetical protein ACOZNI_26215 [Myxococcota bacterium]